MAEMTFKWKLGQKKKVTDAIKLKNIATSQYSKPHIFIRDQSTGSHLWKVNDLEPMKD